MKPTGYNLNATFAALADPTRRRMRSSPSRKKRGDPDETARSQGYYSIRARARHDAGIRRAARYSVRRADQTRAGAALAPGPARLDDAGLRHRSARRREVPLRLAQRRWTGNGHGGYVQGDGAALAPRRHRIV